MCGGSSFYLSKFFLKSVYFRTALSMNAYLLAGYI